LKCVFNIDICRECGGAAQVIVCIEDPVVFKKILDHLNDKAEAIVHTILAESRVLPMGLFT